MTERKYGKVTRGGKGFEVIRRGTLRAVPRETIVVRPPTQDEVDPDLEALGEELEMEMEPGEELEPSGELEPTDAAFTPDDEEQP